MRVISQNGEIDVPYELTAFHSCNGKIRMNMAGDTGRGTEMAVYESQEKALKTMEYLRDAYSDFIADDYGAAIFKFPPDYEVRL